MIDADANPVATVHGAALVVNVPDAENALVPVAQTVCTWNSYNVADVNPVNAKDVVADAAFVQAVAPLTLY